MNTARLALSRGDLQSALRAAQVLSQTPETQGEGLFVEGIVWAEQGQVAKAVQYLEKATQACADVAEYWAQYARLLLMLRRDQEADQAVQKAVALTETKAGSGDVAGVDAMTLDTIGCILARLGDHKGSVGPFTQAVTMAPENPNFRYNLAAACGFTGRVDAAREHYETLLAQCPDDARAHYALSLLSRQTPQDHHVERLEAAIARARHPEDVLRLSYALAKELEDLKEAPRAFTILTKANAEHKRRTGYLFAQDQAVFDALHEAFDQPLAPVDHTLEADPVFVVGMPRTGTTLVDRIITSHPDVASAGELQALPLAIKFAAGTPSRTVLDPETVHAAMGIDPQAIGQAYLARAAQHHRSPKPRYVDKLPTNFLNIGFLARALPHARIVCLRRNPMDTVWSNFRNLFAIGSPYYAYSYDLMDVARYYVQFDKLMALWEKRFPQRVLSVDYETLVADQEAQSRAIVAHCGLTWDPVCLAFHKNREPVATPSAAQVRRKMNRDGIDRWRTHEAGMAEVKAYFEAQGIAV